MTDESDIPLDFKAAARSLLLPVLPGKEEAYLEFVNDYLSDLGIAEDDRVRWLSLELRRWRKSGTPAPEFAQLVQDSLFKEGRAPSESFIFESDTSSSGISYRDVSKKAASNYFTIHGKLISESLFPHDAARQLLSHLGMIVRLRIEESMSASEISRIISIRDQRFEFNWPVIKSVLQPLGLAPNVSKEMVEATFKEDEAAEALLFGDLDLTESIGQIGQLATELGCPGNFDKWLEDLLAGEVHPPFLAILHYQLCALEHFDHAVTYAYEFAPRGQAFLWLNEQYVNAGLPTAKSAFLNNAKATLRLDKGWAVGRDNLRSATALAGILGELENLGTLAKKELGSQIRGLLHRLLRVKSEETGGELPFELPDFTEDNICSLADAASAENTGTAGIIEQRLVDCLAQLENGEEWVPRGIGDSVFAANIPRKKFGDCEFELPERPTPKIRAYESHGGNLSEPYLEDHLGSFAEVLEQRREDLEAVSEIPNWDFTVVFVAHSFKFDTASRSVATLNDGTQVAIEFRTFEELASVITKDPSRSMEVGNRLIRQRLNDRYVHPDVREATLQLAGIEDGE